MRPVSEAYGFGAVKVLFISLLCVGLLLSGLAHLLFPAETEKHMSRAGNVRLAGAILLALVVPALGWRFYLLALLLAIFGLPRLLEPEFSIRLQQRLYSRRVHGVILVIGAVALWLAYSFYFR